MKKPSSVKTFVVIEWLRLLGYLLILIGVLAAPALGGLSGTLSEAVQGFAEALGFQDIHQLAREHWYILGYALGAVALPAGLATAALLGVRDRRFWLSRGGVLLQLLLILGQVSQGNPPKGWGLDLVAVLLTFRGSFKSYFTQPPPSLVLNTADQ